MANALKERKIRKRRFTLSERLGWFVFTFLLTIATLWFASITEHFAFGLREVVIGTISGVVLGSIAAFGGGWLRDVVFWIFFD